ncbi:MAG: nucleotide exchange factor GrpE [Clostridiales bacterium]|nr:nucleotide exchange factor GrpE [Clostridiales bacterium]
MEEKKKFPVSEDETEITEPEKKAAESMNTEAEPEQTEATGAADASTEPRDTELILEAIAKLQQCFDDKIEQDEYKNTLFDNMHRELVRYQNGIMDKIVETLALDIIQLVDSTKGHISIYEKKEPTEDNYKRLLKIVNGIAEDMQDILYRQNIEAYSIPGNDVDTRRQKIIQILETNCSSEDNTTAVRVAEGYEKEGKIIRPERIKIFKYKPDSLSEENE